MCNLLLLVFLILTCTTSAYVGKLTCYTYLNLISFLLNANVYSHVGYFEAQYTLANLRPLFITMDSDILTEVISQTVVKKKMALAKLLTT